VPTGQPVKFMPLTDSDRTDPPVPTGQPVKFMPLTDSDRTDPPVPTGQPVKFMPLTLHSSIPTSINVLPTSNGPIFLPTEMVSTTPLENENDPLSSSEATLSPTVLEFNAQKNDADSIGNQRFKFSYFELGLMSVITSVIVAAGVYSFNRYYYGSIDTLKNEKDKNNTILRLEEGIEKDVSLHGGFAFHEVYDCNGNVPSPSKTGGKMTYQSFWEVVPTMMKETLISKTIFDTNNTERNHMTVEDIKPKPLNLNVPSSPHLTSSITSSPEHQILSDSVETSSSLTTLSFNTLSPDSTSTNSSVCDDNMIYNDNRRSANKFSIGTRGFRL